MSLCIIISLQIIYLSWFESINKRNYSDFLNNTLEQLELKSVSFAADINNIATITSYNDVTYQFVNTQDIDERLKLKNNIEVMIESIMLSNKSINGIIITDLDMVNIGAYRREDFLVINEVKRLYKDSGIQMNQPAHFLFTDRQNGTPLYVCVTKSFSSQAADTDFLTIIIYNTDSFVNNVSSIQPNDNSLFMIIDANQNIVAINRKDLINTGHDWIKAAAIDETGTGKSLVYQRLVSNLKWKVVGITPDAEVTRDLSALKQFAVLTGGIIAAVLLGFGIIINKSITAPITKMAYFMNSIGQNYSARRLEINNKNEISLLARVMNKMLDNIDVMNREVVASQEKVYKAELAKKHAQFSAFQCQVNPHFLYNTLDCIRSIALKREVPEIVDITTSMAKIFRYSIKENDYVRIGDELGCIKDYFRIIQIRQNNRFSIIYEVEESIKDCIIPKMILQPIVENAVFHGLEQKKGTGTLVIHGYETNHTVIFRIEDDGKGMTPDVLQKLKENIAAWNPLEDIPVVQEKKSIGLMNIDRRIKLLYGTQHGIFVESNQDGTKVLVQLPAERNNRN
jgi:two-component system sensor histidine kinase YesM